MVANPLLASWRPDGSDRLPVTEVFLSLQGEGRYAGTPALFIRLKYCNLGCAWCDSRFTWETGSIEEGELLTAAEVMQKSSTIVRKVNVAPDRVHVVFTGGEPMLHQAHIPTVIDKLKGSGFGFFEIETNGAVAPRKGMLDRISWWNCSPKLANNGLSRHQNILPEALTPIRDSGKADFKFVVQQRSDLDEIERDFVPLLGADNIMVMSEGATADSQLAAMPWLMLECSKRGFRFAPRLHVLLWGNARGR